MALPLWLVERLFQVWPLRRPPFLAKQVNEAPLDHEMVEGVLYDEVRSGHRKWLHLLCPKCGEPIQLEAAGQQDSWNLQVDLLCRPTVAPSIWETQSCGAHFFIRGGRLVGCEDN